MNRIDSDAATCRANGWGVGDVLEGDEGNGPERITIRYIGKRILIAENADGDEGLWTLICREWRKVEP